MQSKNTKNLVYFSATTAMIIVGTAFLKIPVPTGYIHLGDGIIFVAGALLGPLALIPAAIGSLIADFIAGAAIYAPVTFVIKGIMGFIAGYTRKSKGKLLKCILLFVIAEAVMVVGYFLFDFALSKEFAFALGGVLYNLIQALAGIVMGILFVPATKRIRL